MSFSDEYSDEKWTWISQMKLFVINEGLLKTSNDNENERRLRLMEGMMYFGMEK